MTTTTRTQPTRPPCSATRWLAWLLLACLALPLPAALAAPVMKVLELSHEGALISWRVNETGRGQATVALCDGCGQDTIMSITSQSRLLVGGTEVPFSDHRSAAQVRVTVFYLPDENRITRIVVDDLPQ